MCGFEALLMWLHHDRHVSISRRFTGLASYLRNNKNENKNVVFSPTSHERRNIRRVFGAPRLLLVVGSRGMPEMWGFFFWSVPLPS